jgi:hypothetical protein
VDNEKLITEADLEVWGEKIAQYKKLHDEVFLLKCKVKDKEVFALVHGIETGQIHIMDLILQSLQNGGLLKAVRIYLENCWIDGDKAILDNPKALLSLVSFVQNITDIGLGEWQKV